MIQGTVNIEILKEGYKTIQLAVLQGLSVKSKFIESQWTKELTESSIKRINTEQEHIKNVAGLIKSFEAIIERLELELQKSRQNEKQANTKAEMALKEANDYMDKYYSAIIRLNALHGLDR